MAEARAAWHPAYIGVGSNLDDPVSQVMAALDGLGELPDSRLIAVSGLYRNPPMGPQDQPEYVNAVAGILTRLGPEDLLAKLQALESQLGRVREAGDRWGPRVIDLDLLVYGTVQQSLPGQILVGCPGKDVSVGIFKLLIFGCVKLIAFQLGL